jgi:hypothetical protein
MRKWLLILVLFSLATSAVDAQLWKLRRYEVTAGIGTTQFFGDIGGYSNGKNILGLKDITFRHTRMNINTGIRYRILDNLSAKLSLAFGFFHSTDARGSNIERGFESRTLFFEPALMGEYYFIKNKGENSFLLIKGKGGGVQSFFSMLDIYGFTGVGGISYKVKPNDLLAAHAAKTGGFSAIIPAGVGVNMIYSANFNFGLEIEGRYSFSDNIDGYTSLLSKSNDIYYSLNFIVTYKLRTNDKGFPVFRRKS